MEVLVDGVESDEEVGEDVLLGGGDVGEERGDDNLSRREGAANGDDCKQKSDDRTRSATINFN